MRTMNRPKAQNAVMRKRRGPAMKKGKMSSMAKTATSESTWNQPGSCAIHQLVQTGIGCVK